MSGPCAFADMTEQLVFLAFGVSKIIVGELTVFLLQLSLHLVPSAFECEFVHSHFSVWHQRTGRPEKSIRARASGVVGAGFFTLSPRSIGTKFAKTNNRSTTSTSISPLRALLLLSLLPVEQ